MNVDGSKNVSMTENEKNEKSITVIEKNQAHHESTIEEDPREKVSKEDHVWTVVEKKTKRGKRKDEGTIFGSTANHTNIKVKNEMKLQIMSKKEIKRRSDEKIII